MSSFASLNTATTALWAQQRGLEVTGQNIANVNTEGYSRQRAELRAMGGSPVLAVHSISSSIGSGVSADQITRIRDAFLEARAQVESAGTARLAVASSALAQVEQAFHEPGDSGIQSMLGDVWSGWSDLANSPLEPAARSQVIERMQTLTAGLRTTRGGLDQQWDQTRDSLTTLVADVNEAITAIAELNQAIKRATLAGLPANQLSDSRDTLVLGLATQIGATATPAEDGAVNVSVGGTTLVSGSSAIAVRLAGVASPDGVGTGNDPRIVTDPGGTPLRVGGTAEGRLAVLTDTVPRYRAQVDELARTIAGKLNAAHTAGFDAAGDAGEPLFDDGSGTIPVDLSRITAANLTLRITSSERIAAASVSFADAGGRPSADGGNADAFYRLSLEAGGIDVGYRQMVVALGVESSVATRNLGIQEVITGQVNAAREASSGVNLDEEMTRMLAFQHAYNAAARMVTTIDQALETLIMRTGVVGR